MFTDRVKIQLQAGKGGNGIVAWRREKYIPKGGPYGGDGGRGGDIKIISETHSSSLEWFRHKRHLKAESGQQGGTNRRRGRKGKDLILRVPCGTLVKDGDTGEILHDLTKPGQEVLLCQGGVNGRGNAGFATPTRQAPNFATLGKTGETAHIELELKMIADVGLVGFPNAGKSTLLGALTYRKVKIAPYPFTTLRPNLGFLKEQTSTTTPTLVADIPGIIAGAHQNKGLGFSFLRHIERTSLLLFVLDASGIDGRTPSQDFTTLENELKAYSDELSERKRVVVLNKCDTEESKDLIQEFTEQHPLVSVLEISATEQTGISSLIEEIKTNY